MGFEPATACLQNRCSTVELRQRSIARAGGIADDPTRSFVGHGGLHVNEEQPRVSGRRSVAVRSIVLTRCWCSASRS